MEYLGGGSEYLGEGGWCTWDMGVGVPGRLEYMGEGVGESGRGNWVGLGGMMGILRIPKKKLSKALRQEEGFGGKGWSNGHSTIDDEQLTRPHCHHCWTLVYASSFDKCSH